MTKNDGVWANGRIVSKVKTKKDESTMNGRIGWRQKKIGVERTVE